MAELSYDSYLEERQGLLKQIEDLRNAHDQEIVLIRMEHQKECDTLSADHSRFSQARIDEVSESYQKVIDDMKKTMESLALENQSKVIQAVNDASNKHSDEVIKIQADYEGRLLKLEKEKEALQAQYFAKCEEFSVYKNKAVKAIDEVLKKYK